jgi:hypothetical protein
MGNIRKNGSFGLMKYREHQMRGEKYRNNNFLLSAT